MLYKEITFLYFVSSTSLTPSRRYVCMESWLLPSYTVMNFFLPYPRGLGYLQSDLEESLQYNWEFLY